MMSEAMSPSVVSTDPVKMDRRDPSHGDIWLAGTGQAGCRLRNPSRINWSAAGS